MNGIKTIVLKIAVHVQPINADEVDREDSSLSNQSNSTSGLAEIYRSTEDTTRIYRPAEKTHASGKNMDALKGVNILEKEYLVVPMHQKFPQHFLLAIVVQSRDKDGKVTSEITVFNSSRSIVKENRGNVQHENKPASVCSILHHVESLPLCVGTDDIFRKFKSSREFAESAAPRDHRFSLRRSTPRQTDTK